MNNKDNFIENCGAKFNIEIYLDSRIKTINAVKKTASEIIAGMSEVQAESILSKNLKNIGVEKFWHPTKIRFNKNTTKNFRDISSVVTLEKNDLFFIDIGPVINQHEADYGETFVIGADSKLLKLQSATQEIFQATQRAWKNNHLSGVELYKYAELEARKLNLSLNLNMFGHRLGDFPHALYYKGKLGSIDLTPLPNLWVLEIHLIDESINRGAFFEDILI